MKVAFVARSGNADTGVGRYVMEVVREVRARGYQCEIVPPAIPMRGLMRGIHRHLRIDLDAFLGNYPLWAGYPTANVYHLASQNLASLLLHHHPKGKVVVTVHDIIPYLVRHNRCLCAYAHPMHRVFDYLAMRGLKRADVLLADSTWTKETLVHELGISEHRIRVIYLGVDTIRFQPMAVPREFWPHYGLEATNRHVLYVGSEDPRKNLDTLLRAFALVGQGQHKLRLLKVGAPRHFREHQRLVLLAEELGISAKVHWVGHVPDRDLPLFYNAADVYVMPSRCEGFGLPVLEALACGARVVSSNVTSLPEVAGADSVLCAPTVDGIGQAVARSLELADDELEREERRGWAQTFSWPRTAEKVCEVYQHVGSDAQVRRKTPC